MTGEVPDRAHLERAAAGALLGAMVGDAIGLPFEGMSRQRIARIVGDRPLGHRLILGRGMVSDDTEHLGMTAAALIRSRGDPKTFARSLAWRMRLWLLGIPGGVGLATLRATLKLWALMPPEKSGVYSAGNGPVMRAPIIGLWPAPIETLFELVRRSSRLTHTDPRAEQGALAVALAARLALCEGPKGRIDGGRYLECIEPHLPDRRMRETITAAVQAAEADECATAFADQIGCTHGISGFVLHTAPIVIFCWLRYQDDFERAVEECVRLGGDTDSTAATVGALVGAGAGPDAIPDRWLQRCCDFPRSAGWAREVAGRFAAAALGESLPPRRTIRWAALPPRNALFIVIVLGHALRRLLPPYGGRRA